MADTLQRIAEGLCDRYLEPYVERLRREGLSRPGPKQVHDPVWGTISIKPLEVALLDSPLLQRLRHLRQLGVAHWVYPGADHSRFEHTLGVLHQTQQLASAINRAAVTAYDKGIIDDETLDMLRIAALMHDVGHPVLSHVSEYALRLEKPVLLEIARERKHLGEQVTVSELVAAKVVRAPAFRSLLAEVGEIHRRAGLPGSEWARNPEPFADRVARTILGQCVSNTVPLLHEIVSGPYDADKLDYMIRDPRAAGIPDTIDISRLVQKLTIRRMTGAELPEPVNKLVEGRATETFMFGFPWSGIPVIDELLLGRMILYAKLYRHPKVAAIEAMVQSLLDQIAVLTTPTRVIEFVYNVLDDQLVLADRAELLTRLALTEDDVAAPEKVRALEIAVDLVRCLRERELFVRAFAFFPGQPQSEHDEVASTFNLILKLIDAEGSREQLRRDIVEEAKKVFLELGGAADSFHYRNADQLIVVRRLQPPSQKELRHAWIFPTGGTPRTIGKTGINRDAWSGSFVSASAKGYVIAPKALSESAYIAAEAVIANRFKIAVPEWMMEETKQSTAALRPAKMKLRERGYYREKPRIIRPIRDRLLKNDVGSVVSEFAARFAAVQEAVVADMPDYAALNGPATLEQRTYAWLDQFDSNEHVECGLELLRRARLVSRQDIVAAVTSFVGANPAYGKASVISLSAGNDSSQIVQYFVADSQDGLTFHGSLEEAAEAARAEPVIVVDDFCGSGNQWANTIGSLFDRPDVAKADLNENRRKATPEEREYLIGREVAFVFTSGWNIGRETVLHAATQVGLNARVHVQLDETQIPFARPVLEAAGLNEHADDFLAHADEIGRTLLRQAEPNWSDEKLEQRGLGYGNRGMLLFFPYNAPSQTLTCMWAAGTWDDGPWQPLVRRRKKVVAAVT